MIKIDRFLSLE